MKLQTQFTLTFVPLLLFSGLGTTWLAKRAVHQTTLETVASRGEAALGEASSRVAAGLQTGNESTLLPVLAALLAKENAVYAMAVNPRGRVLAHTNVLEAGKTYDDPAARDILASGKPTVHEVVLAGERVLDVSWPVWSDSLRGAANLEEFLLAAPQKPAGRKRLGTLRMGYPMEQYLLREARILHDLTLLLFCTSALILGLAVLFVRNLLRPVGGLIQATEDISSGVYGAAVPVPAATELAALARSFNRMSGTLSQTTVSKDFLDTILSNMRHPLIVLEAEGRIRMINRAALELLEYRADELLGAPFAVVCATAGNLMDTVRRMNFLEDGEVQLLTRSKTAIPVSFSGSAFGAAGGVIVVAQDMRERLKLERERVQTAKLSAVGLLASGVAHEINNPLGVILGFAEAILFDIKPGDAMEGPLREIERETIRCRDLVQDLLTFSRVSGTEREAMDFNQAVESALSLVQAQAHIRAVAIVRELAPDLPRILGASNQIQQVVINLAANAIDATGEGGTVTVRTALKKEGGRSYVALSVIDTGSGIPEDVLPRIFEPFFTTKPVGKGTGLGLGLVHEIAQKHSATIQVESRPGHTQFVVEFPAPINDNPA